MEVSELRIGNLVEHNGSTWRIYSIKGPSPLPDPRYSDKILLDIWNNGLVTVSLDEVSPIEITGELLESLGFHFDKGKKGNSYYLIHQESTEFNRWVEWFNKDKTIKILNVDKNILDFNLCTEEMHHRCIYVHELQNFWYDLFNEELKL
jgi:hypothetical protein